MELPEEHSPEMKFELGPEYPAELKLEFDPDVLTPPIISILAKNNVSYRTGAGRIVCAVEDLQGFPLRRHNGVLHLFDVPLVWCNRVTATKYTKEKYSSVYEINKLLGYDLQTMILVIE